ncbi:MAG: bacteriohemerythrin [Treponema sp.]|nr:bacteriohemerythrin [Treponema sp.]
MDYRNELITWSSKFACGIKLIDEQHKGLVSLVNDMFNHVSGNEKEEQEYFCKVIKEAVKYIKIHFATEEKIMLAAKFKGYAEHKRKHDTFVFTVIESINSYEFGCECGKRLSLLTFTKFLKDWILTHIALMDKQYFDYLRKIASRKSNGRLSVTRSDVVVR